MQKLSTGELFETQVLMARCGRCGHQWIPRTDVVSGVLPKACPACFSHFWNEPYANRVEGGPPPTKPRKTRSDKGTSRGSATSRRVQL